MKTRSYLGVLAALGFAWPLWAEPSVDSVIATNLLEPISVVASSDGYLYVSDGAGHRVLRYHQAAGTLQILAGLTGVPGTNNGTGIQSRFYQVEGMVAARGGLVVADSGNHLIRFVAFNGVVTTLAGAPRQMGFVDGVGDGARFRYPLGLAADAAGNVYIADSKNNAIRKLDLANQVTTVVSNLNEPAAVAVGANGDLWVADTRRHQIKRVLSDGTVMVMAGAADGSSGYLDHLLATEAILNSPRGLLWLGNSGLLISDSGNNVIRRLFFNPAIGDYSVETFAGVAGPGGFRNGSVYTALFSAPLGLSRDLDNGGFLVADRANQQVRRITTQPPLPPVTAPKIGWVSLDKDSFGSYVTRLNEITTATFNNAVTIAILGEAGTQTFFTYGATPSSSLEDTIPAPGPGTGSTPPFYADGRPAAEMPPSIIEPQPDVTIKAIGTQDGRRSSDIVTARLQFKVGGPTISGDNAAYFTVETATADAELYYTTDGSEPTNSPAANPACFGPIQSGDVISLQVRETNLVFKVRGFRQNFKPSEVSTKIFSPSNFVANTIGFGFDSGEASSQFIGAPGQRFYAPVTLSVLPATKLYSLQFNVVATNLTGQPVDGTKVGFQSMLHKPIPGVQPPVYVPIPPAMFVTYELIPDSSTNTILVPVFTNLLFTNPAVNLLGVGWVERLNYANLYDSTRQDLITYSIAHDRLYESKDGKVILGGYSFVIPPGSVEGETFQIRLDRASGTADGISQDIYLATPTNQAIKTVRVGAARYLVGDVAPFRWFNAGDYGNSNLLNNDVVQVFQSAVYEINKPPRGSDFYDAMDSCCWDANRQPLPTHDLMNGSSATINAMVFGDGELDVRDVFVTFRRSLDPTLKWYERYWGNSGQRQYVEVPNGAPPASAPAPLGPVAKTGTLSRPLWAVVSAEDVVCGSQRTIQVPIQARLGGGLAVPVLMLNITVQPLENTPALTTQVTFTPASSLGAPTLSASRTLGNYSAAWLDNTAAGISGTNLIGTLTVTLPEQLPPGSAYRVHFEHASLSPNGLALIPCQTLDGLITVTALQECSRGDGISDLWRLRFFGGVALSDGRALADADGDGVCNYAEYLAGTNPLDSNSVLRLNTDSASAERWSGPRLRWQNNLHRRQILEYRDSLLSGEWMPLYTNQNLDGAVTEITDPGATGKARFYRLRVAE